MRISQDYVKSVVPKRYPPPEFVPPLIRDASLRMRQDTLRRSLLWTAAIFSALRQTPEPTFQVRRLRDERGASLSQADFIRLLKILPPDAVSVGLLDPELEAPGFGLIVRSAHGEVSGEFLGEMVFPRLGAAVPIVISSVEEMSHLNAPRRPRVNPVGGCATCWAIEKGTSQKGILTAKHCTNGFNCGSPIPLAPKGSGVVARKGLYSIDAAFISLRGRGLSGRSQLTTVSYPAAGMPVVLCFPTGHVRATIKDVATNHLGILDDHNLPIVVFTDACGVAGQSGSLLAAKGGAGVGIYLGTSTTRGGLVVGRSQHLEQARLLLNIGLFK